MLPIVVLVLVPVAVSVYRFLHDDDDEWFTWAGRRLTHCVKTTIGAAFRQVYRPLDIVLSRGLT